MKRTVLVLALMLGILLPHAALALEAGDPEIQKIVDRVDRIFRSSSSVSKLEMSIVTENWERTLTMDMWTEGMDRTFIRILGPRKDRGIATLRVDTEMWNYFPKINKVMKVPPSMMMGSWMGSDFTNDDLVKESSMTRDYTYSLVEPPEPDPDHYYVELRPKADTAIVWGKIIVKVRREDYIPVMEEFFDERGRKMRVMHLKDIRPMGGKTIPTVIELIPLNKEGQKTLIRYISVEFDKELGKDVFTLRNLRKRL
jgi:outer membrane lipoprotein-sorting protein